MATLPLGHQLRALRIAARRTVASVAADAGLSVPYIANLENGRGNPTVTALSRLAGALDRQLVITLAPAGTPAAGSPEPAPEIPSSLTRFGRSARFRSATTTLAEAWQLDSREAAHRLVTALAGLAGTLGLVPGETDWGRLLDAILLVATQPQPG